MVSWYHSILYYTNIIITYSDTGMKICLAKQTIYHNFTKQYALMEMKLDMNLKYMHIFYYCIIVSVEYSTNLRSMMTVTFHAMVYL